MKRLHVHVAVDDPPKPIAFYASLFDEWPNPVKPYCANQQIVGERPPGIRWETFFTFGDATTYGEDEPGRQENSPSACGAKPSSC